MRDKSKNIQQLTLKDLTERAGGEVRSGQTNDEEREKQEGGSADICDSSLQVHTEQRCVANRGGGNLQVRNVKEVKEGKSKQMRWKVCECM